MLSEGAEQRKSNGIGSLIWACCKAHEICLSVSTVTRHRSFVPVASTPILMAEQFAKLAGVKGDHPMRSVRALCSRSKVSRAAFNGWLFGSVPHRFMVIC